MLQFSAQVSRQAAFLLMRERVWVVKHVKQGGGTDKGVAAVEIDA